MKNIYNAPELDIIEKPEDWGKREIDTLEKLIAAFEKPEQGKSRFAVFKNFPEFSSSGAERSQNEGAANP